MGGAAGHMAHPFDLGWVKTGSDLISFFDKAKQHLEAEGVGSVKIDGVNVSFKVVEANGKYQFAVDRGSMKEIDISGITMDRVDQRFPEGHGMRPAIKTLLTILNEALPNIQNELGELGMLGNPSLFLNTEYVEGTTNVTNYDENFLAIHGLNQFYERTAKSGASKGNVRPGAERPPDIKSPSIEIPYSDEVMEKLIAGLNPIAEQHGFKVYGSVPTEKKSDIDYSDTLSEQLTIQISPDREITKSLGKWLSTAQNPGYGTIKLKTGKALHPLHKELYKTILNREASVVDLVEEPDAEAAINGTLFMHATRMLGNDVLRGLTSPMGDVMNHEGVVLRDEDLFGPNPVKITGEFILGGMASNFQTAQSLEEVEEDNYDTEADDWYELRHQMDQELGEPAEDESDDPVVDVDFPKTVAVVPGAFKPPHNGHLAMVRAYADEADEVIVLISRPTKSGRKLPNGREITAEDSLKIWELLTDGMSNVDIQISTHASPLTAAYEYVGKDGPIEPGTEVILGASTKGDDWKRWEGAEKYIKEGVTLVDPRTTAVLPTTRPNGEPFSATDMRHLIGAAENDPDAIEELEEFIGEENVFDLLSILGVNAPVNEMAAMGGGAVAIGTGKIPKEDEDNIIRRENIDLSTIDEVMRLIMERGILR